MKPSVTFESLRAGERFRFSHGAQEFVKIHGERYQSIHGGIRTHCGPKRSVLRIAPPAASRSAGPQADAIRAAREAAQLTQAAAAALLHTDGRVWRQWELGERQMHPAFFELFILKTGGAR